MARAPSAAALKKLAHAEMRAFEKELCERSFYEFVRRAWREIDRAPFIDNWHIKVICDHLQAIVDPPEGFEPILRLLINVCPGSAKSNLVNVLFPAWLWTRDPSKRIISTSHKDKLAIRDSTKTRRLIVSRWYQSFWPIGLQTDQDSKGEFENTHMGARVASPFGSMTGSRGNIVIVDDPHSVDDAKSAAHRASAVETFLEAIPSRLNSMTDDAIIVIMQRLHEEDVSGAILSRPGMGYDHLCIPLICDGVDRPATSIGWKDHREEGENMFPSRFPERVVDQLRASMGPFAFAGQYQQDPSPATDGFLRSEWFHRFKPSELPAQLHYYMTSDHAPSGKGDWNVFRIWGVDENRHLWLVDSFRKKCLMNEALGVAVDTKTGRTVLASEGALPLIRKWKPLTWFPENDNTWSAMKGFAEAYMLETDTFCHIEPLATKGSGDKIGKAQAYQAMAAMGLVHLPEGGVGDTALEEYAKFPVGKHDDQVDADGAIARVIDSAHGAFVAPAPKAVTERDWNEQRVLDPSDLYWT